MSEQIRQIVTILALNRDDDPAAVDPAPINTWQKGDCTYILNMRTFPSDNGDGGKAKNVKGNVEVVFGLPAGVNKYIGMREDKQQDTVLIFVQNSLGNHSILRYWHTRGPIGEIDLLMQGPFLNFSANGTIHSANIVGDLLYWAQEDNEPRKINMVQAAGTGKQEVHDLYFGQMPSGVVSRTLSMTLIRNGLTVATVSPLLTATGSAVTNLDNFSLAVAAAANANATLSAFMVFAAFGKKVTATAKGLGVFEVVMSATDAFASSPSTSAATWNQPVSKYLAISDPYIIAQIVPYYDLQPFASYISDSTRQSNFVAQRLFQFAVRILRTDYEESVFSSFSNVALPQGACVGGETLNNCIELSFNSPRLINKDWLCVIRAVQIMVRECLDSSGADFGEWKNVATLYREDFVLNPVYRFYNEQHYAPVSVEDSTRLYDTIPLRAVTQEHIQSGQDTRAVLSGCTEDFDTPSVPINLTQTFSDENPISGSTGEVEGYFYIHCPYASDNPGSDVARFNGFIHDRGDGPVWGGIGTAIGFLIADPSEPGVGSDYGQRFGNVPGFCVYSAGLPYYTFAKMVNPGTFGVPGGSLSLDLLADNVIDTSRYGFAVFPKNTTGREASRWAMRAGVIKIYFRIRLPVGVHILRIASPRVGTNDDNGPEFNANNTNLAWQKSSCPLSQMGGIEGATEITVTVTPGGLVTIGDTYVVDFTNPDSSVGGIFPGQTKAIRSYSFDNNGEDNADLSLRNGTQLECQRQFIFTGVPLSSNVAPIVPQPYAVKRKDGTVSPVWQEMMSGFLRTDHNGFAWAVTDMNRQLYAAMYGVTADGTPGSAVVVDFAATNNTTLAYTVPGHTLFEFSDDYYIGGLTGGLAPGSGDLGIPIGVAQDYIFYNNDVNGSFDNMESISTTITGRIADAGGNGIAGLKVLFENTGRVVKTDDLGGFEIKVLADSVENLNNRGVTRMGTILNGYRDRLIVRSELLCSVTFPGGEAIALHTSTMPAGVFGIQQFETAQAYSETVFFPQEDILALIVPAAVRSIFGRGATPQFGAILMDDGGRVTTVATSDSNVVRIPFATQNLRLFDPATYPTDTFRPGPVTIGWQLPGAVPIPKVGRFTKYRFAVTFDGSRSKIFEWAANDVRYVQRYDDATGDTISGSFGDANEIYFSVQNIDYYREENTDSQVAYTYQAGDRIVFICNQAGTLFTSADGIFDLAITGERTTTTAGVTQRWITVENRSDLPEFEPGCLFLIYTPAKTTNTKVFYEFGPWYYILNPYSDTPAWSVPSGTFTEGFDYYRQRRIPVRPSDSGPSYVQVSVEDTSASDFYTSNVWGRGRPNLFDPNVRQVYYTGRHRWSQAFVPGTKVNGLSSYYALSFEDISTEYGRIIRTIMVGEVFLVACLNRLISRYPGKQSFEQALPDGALSANSDRVLGSIHIDAGNYGCSHGESLVVNKTHLYGFDLNNGLVFRKAVNQTFSISGAYKMQRDIAEKARLYRQLPLGTYQIWGAFDKYFEEYIIAFPAVDVTPTSPLREDGTGLPTVIEAETLSFHEPSNRWMTAYSYTPECMCGIGMEVIIGQSAAIWLQNRNPVRNSFCGIVYPSIAEVVMNQYPAKRKRALNVEVKASHAPNVPEVRTDTGQISLIEKGNFMAREADFYSEFFRNTATVGVTNPIVNGETLVGNVFYLRLEINETGKALFTSITVATVPSERSQK